MIFQALVGLILLSSPSPAATVSLLQESQDIICTTEDESSDLASLWIDKKDYLLKLTDKKGAVEEFDQVNFLDRGILAKSKADGKKFMFVQVFMNGQWKVHLGAHLKFKEKDCKDVGAAKKCTNPEIGELLWTPEKLALKKSDAKRAVDISDYGHFPNNATYTFGQQTKKEKQGYPSLLLIDFGAPVELLVGHSLALSCRY